jgi:circadian clock protein KaiB
MTATSGDVAADRRTDMWNLRLYIAGQSPMSLRALANLQKLCDEHLAGHYEIEVVDLIEHPQRAQADDIIAIPTLIRTSPAPERRAIGDLSRTDRVLEGLQMDGCGLTMAPAPVPTDPAAPAAPASGRDQVGYELTLFISGSSALSRNAIADTKRLCDTHLPGRYSLSVLDFVTSPDAVRRNRVLASPTLVRTSPLPERRYVGDLSRTQHVLQALGLTADDDAPTAG